jgi:soluble lytic murein transglycosylase-like protein
MKSKDWIIISLIGVTLLVLRKAYAESPLIDNPDIKIALENANLGIVINSDEYRVMNYASIMVSEGQKQGIAPEIIAGIMRAESSGVPSAKRYESNVNDWSYGLMQMLTKTAAWMKELNASLSYTKGTDLFIPSVSIQLGTYYLRLNYNKYLVSPKKSPLTDMIASYNAGVARLNTANLYIDSAGNTDVNDYVNRVMGYKSRFRLMFQYLYPNYNSQFPSSVWGR